MPVPLPPATPAWDSPIECYGTFIPTNKLLISFATRPYQWRATAKPPIKQPVQAAASAGNKHR